MTNTELIGCALITAIGVLSALAVWYADWMDK